MPGLVPGIHVHRAANKTWMAGTSPATTWKVGQRNHKTLSCGGFEVPTRGCHANDRNFKFTALRLHRPAEQAALRVVADHRQQEEYRCRSRNDQRGNRLE